MRRPTERNVPATVEPASSCEPALQRLLERFGHQTGMTNREIGVLWWAASRGLSIKQIASEIHRSPKTVEQAWSRIYVKTGQASQLEVLARLLREALASPLQ